MDSLYSANKRPRTEVICKDSFSCRKLDFEFFASWYALASRFRATISYQSHKSLKVNDKGKCTMQLLGRCPSLVSFLLIKKVSTFCCAVIGYGITTTGFTVIAGVLIATLGLSMANGGDSFRRKRKSLQTLQQRRRQFIEQCQIHPHLPGCFKQPTRPKPLKKGKFNFWSLF